MKHQLPAGILTQDANIEFFASLSFKAYCLHNGKVLSYSEFHPEVIARLEADMISNPVKHRAIQKMAACGRAAEIEQYTICTYGGFDNVPDMINGQLQAAEYWPCPKRGTCKFEGIACTALATATGARLSKREIEVIRLIASGHLDKHIAVQLRISIGTVTTHTRNIRSKTGLFRKADITRFATEKNLL